MPRLRLAILPLFFLVLFIKNAQGQLFFAGTEYGITIGGSQYFGDLNDSYGLKFIRPAGGIFIRQHLNPYISVRASLTATNIGYDDKLNTNAYEKYRNLNFTSHIVELSAQSEFNFIRFTTGEENHRFTPYLTGGIGVFYYDPVSVFNGKHYSLRKLGTEGQNLAEYKDRKYNSFAVCFPVGVGFKYWVKPGLNLGFEIADRLTLTDYLDDVSTSYVGADKFPTNPDYPNPAYTLQDRSAEPSSPSALGRAGKQRGNTSSYDQYMYGVFNISFQLKVYRCPSYLKEGILE
ncbi:MAG: DUF6089 family protein [Chitinophagaceae bacterium]